MKLNTNRIKLYLDETPGKSLRGLSTYMGKAVNTVAQRIKSGDCMLSELGKIMEYTGLTGVELTEFHLGEYNSMVAEPKVMYEVNDTRKQLIESQKEQIKLLQEKIVELTKGKKRVHERHQN